MCLFTVYLHNCGHPAAGPIATYPCFWDCDPVTEVEILRQDFCWPFDLRPELEPIYHLLESLCRDCAFMDPYEDIEVPGVDDLIWHVPYVSCDEDLFRPVDFNPTPKSHGRTRAKVSQQELQVGDTSCSISELTSFDEDRYRDNIDTRSTRSIRPTAPCLSQTSIESSGNSLSYDTAQTHITPQSFVRERPAPLPRYAFDQSNFLPLLPGLHQGIFSLPNGAQPLRPYELSYHDENEDFDTSAQFALDQMVWETPIDTSLTPHPVEYFSPISQALHFPQHAQPGPYSQNVDWTPSGMVCELLPMESGQYLDNAEAVQVSTIADSDETLESDDEVEEANEQDDDDDEDYEEEDDEEDDCEAEYDDEMEVGSLERPPVPLKWHPHPWHTVASDSSGVEPLVIDNQCLPDVSSIADGDEFHEIEDYGDPMDLGEVDIL